MVVLPRAHNLGWRSAGIACLCLVAASWPAAALAHDVSEQAKLRLLNGHWLEVIWIGAEHMLTGYDHLLFLLGVLFFLTSARQIVYFVTAFTFGHTLTLLFATLAGITANAYLVDAVIALTVCYKAFENLGGFRRYLGIEPPNLLFMVFLFGLIHGFGLSTRLQQMTLVDDPYLVAKILGFNVGVEVGQIAALLVMGAIVALWRETPAWRGVARTANVLLLLCGAALCAWQIAAYQDAAAQGAALDDNGPTREREFASQ
jgi:hypothetical protein